MLITPARGESGVANITLQVSNGIDTVTTTFKVTVISVTLNCTITGTDTCCQNDTLNYFTTKDDYAYISWRADNGSIIGPNNDTTLKVLWYLDGIGNLVLTKTSIISGRQDSLSIPIIINAIPPKPIITKFDDTLFSNAADGNQWYYFNKLIPGAVNNKYITTQDGDYTLQVTLNNCISPLSDVYHFVYTGYFDLSINGANITCQNDTIIYYTPSENNVTISWRVDNGIIIGSISDSTLKVFWDSVGLATIYLTKENSSIGQKDSTYMPVTINELPPKPVITKNLNTLYSSSAQGNQWFKNGIKISGEIRNFYNATEDGTYTVQVTLNGCPSPFSDEYNFTFSYFDLTITGSQSACQNDTLKYLTPAENNVVINWKAENGTIIGKSDSSEVSVNWKNIGNGNIILIKDNTSIGKKDSATIDITINEIPQVANIYHKVDTLYSSAPQGNQWYRNGNLIPGATGNTYVTLIDGKYSVIVTLNGCSSPMTPEYNFIAGVDEEFQTEQFSVIPNPANDKLHISTKNGNAIGNIEFYSVLGNRVYSAVFEEDKVEIDLSSFPAGIYLVKIGNFRKLIVKN